MTEIVLFGVTGDLARQKLIPALFNVFVSGKVTHRSSFLGFGRKPFSKEGFRQFIEGCLKEYLKKQVESTYSDKIELYDMSLESKIHEFCNQWEYVCSELTDDSGYIKLASKLKGENSTRSSIKKACLIYISLPPAFQLPVSKKLLENKVITKDKLAISKIAFEKPFGSDATSSKKLQNFLTKKLDPKQILRIDHYAGKQALVELDSVAKQGIFQQYLNSSSVSKIEIRLNESIDVLGRGAFYDSVGAVKDILQNHMLYMLSLTLSLPLHSQYKDKILQLLAVKGKPVFGQYMGYLDIAGVAQKSKIETFFDVHLELSKKAIPKIKNNRKKNKKVVESESAYQKIYKTWKGIDIRLIGGKALSKSEASITLYFKDKKDPMKILVNGYGTKDAYEKIFEDMVQINPDRFVSFEQVQKGWEIVESIKKKNHALAVYPVGSSPEMLG